MDSIRTEGIGVAAVSEFLLNSATLIPRIDSNDRTESWDGSIFVFKSGITSKNNFSGRIPVQIKANSVKKFSGLEKSIQMDVSDLSNYLIDGGVIIFSVEHCGKDRKLFYISLLPYDLDELIKGLKQNQKTKTIKLFHIAYNETSKFENICREFLLHQSRQRLPLLFDFPYDKVNEIMMEGIINKNDNLESVLLSQPQYLYGKASMDSKLYEYVTKVDITAIEKKINSPIQVNDVDYYPGYSVVKTKDTITIRVGQDLRFIIDGTKFMLKMGFKGNLLERIHDTNFILDFLKSKTIVIADRGKIVIGDLEKGYEEKISHLNEDLKNLLAVLDIFRINPDDVDLDNLQDNDIKVINILIGATVLNRKVKPEIFKSLPGLFYFNFGNKKILTFVELNDNSKVVIQNFFDLKLKVKFEQEDISVSPYLVLKIEDIIDCSNFKLNEMIVDVTKYEHSPGYDILVNNLALRLISAYDESAKEEYLEYANDLLSWLEGSMDDIIININKLQIIKRNRTLTEHEKKYLSTLIEKNELNDNLLCGIYILLDNIKKYEACFEKLTADEQQSFKSYPILSLLKKPEK